MPPQFTDGYPQPIDRRLRVLPNVLALAANATSSDRKHSPPGLRADLLSLFAADLPRPTCSRPSRDKVNDLKRTAIDGAQSPKRAGFPKMADMFGEGAAKKAADWLGYKGRGTLMGKSPSTALSLQTRSSPRQL